MSRTNLLKTIKIDPRIISVAFNWTTGHQILHSFSYSTGVHIHVYTISRCIVVSCSSLLRLAERVAGIIHCWLVFYRRPCGGVLEGRREREGGEGGRGISFTYVQTHSLAPGRGLGGREREQAHTHTQTPLVVCECACATANQFKFESMCRG